LTSHPCGSAKQDLIRDFGRLESLVVAESHVITSLSLVRCQLVGSNDCRQPMAVLHNGQLTTDKGLHSLGWFIVERYSDDSRINNFAEVQHAISDVGI
jgi:hypothetical protein